MGTQGYTSVAVADPSLALRKTQPDDEESQDLTDLSDDEMSERDEVEQAMRARKRYSEDRKSKENEWTQSFKMYVSWMDAVTNPFLSNLFIPKTHEAVELLSAFLIGTNQSITASPENGSSDTVKAQVAGKWLEFLWRKTLKARMKILVWIKQGIVFGNGILKVGWDNVNDTPWMAVRPIEDVYFDYFEADIQDSEYVFDEIRRLKEDVINDERYDLKDSDGTFIRENVIEGGTGESFQTEAIFSTYDNSLRRPECSGKVLVLEAWCKKDNMLKTFLPTSNGWRVARRVENPNYYKMADGSEQYFRPFVKLRFKASALPNRAYDVGAVWPTVRIQKAFNDLYNEYFDSVVMVNAPMWIKRRGARINPVELVRRPGGVITVSDINKDLKSEGVNDVKQSIIEMLNRLDCDFQEASMVVNLLKGLPGGGDTATEASIGQENVQTLLDMIDQNIVDALSEAGQMVLAISLINQEKDVSLKLYENDSEIGMLKFKPGDIDGYHDVKIAPDRSSSNSKAILAKQMLDFLAIVARDPVTTAKYPNLQQKIYKRWLEDQGVSDPDYFFQEDNATAAPAPTDQGGGAGKVSVSMSYKDVPDDVKREIEGAAGLKPSTAAPTIAPAAPAAPDTGAGLSTVAPNMGIMKSAGMLK